MGRSKVEMKKVASKVRRHITFTKRKSGLLKKAYELSTMSDVEVVLIIFSSSGKLFLYESKGRVEEVLTKFLNHPIGRGLHNRQHILDLISQMNEELRVHQQARTSGDDEQDVDAQIEDVKNQIELVTAQMKEDEEGLEVYLKDVDDIKTMAELKSYESTLLDTLKKVQNQKKLLESKNETLVNLESQAQYANRSHYLMGMGSSSSHPWTGSTTIVGNTNNTNDNPPSGQERGHHQTDLLGNEVHSFGTYLEENMSFPSMERIVPSQAAFNTQLYFPQRDYSGGIAFRNPTTLDDSSWNLSPHIGTSVQDSVLVDPPIPLRVGQEGLNYPSSFVGESEANQYVSNQHGHDQLRPLHTNIEQQRMLTPLAPPAFATGAPQAFYSGHVWPNSTLPITHGIGVQNLSANQAPRFQSGELSLPPTYSEGYSFVPTIPARFGTENPSGSNDVENGSTSKEAEGKGKEIHRDYQI